MFEKKKRIENINLLEEIKMQSCVVCNKKPPNDADHISTKGAGNGDELSNLWSLCRLHHSEKHSAGLVKFVDKYENAKKTLIMKGWIYENNLRKWKRNLD